MKSLLPPHPDTRAVLGESKAASWQYRYDHKAEPQELPRAIYSVIDAMLYGVSEDIVVDGRTVRAGTPIGLPLAAKALGLHIRSVRRYSVTEIFQLKLRAALRSKYALEDPANIATAVSIRDDLTLSPTERLKAIDRLRVRELPAPVNVNISQRVGIANVVPGYVIKLDENAPLPNSEESC